MQEKNVYEKEVGTGIEKETENAIEKKIEPKNTILNYIICSDLHDLLTQIKPTTSLIIANNSIYAGNSRNTNNSEVA